MTQPEDPKPEQAPEETADSKAETAPDAPRKEEGAADTAAAAEPDADTEAEAAEEGATAEEDAADEDTVKGPSIEVLQAQLVATMGRVAELDAQLQDTTAKLRAVSKAYKDLQDDYEHFRQRTAQQSEVKAERKSAEAVHKFFEPVQNLKRSLDAVDDDNPLAGGLKMVLHQFNEAMNKLGLEQVPGAGADFDPNFHEALAVTPVDDPALDGKILHVHNDGYRVKNQLIQAAQVVIGKHEPPPAPVEPEPDDGSEPAAAAEAPEEPGDDEPHEEPSNGV